MKKNINTLKEMITIEEIKENLEGLCVSIEEFQDAVIEAFEDYEFNGETEVIVSDNYTEVNVEGYGMCQQWNAYINVADSPIIVFQTIENEGKIKIVNVD